MILINLRCCFPKRSLNCGSSFILIGFWWRRYNRVACPKFRHPTLSSELWNYELNTEFVAALGILRKIKSLFERWNNFKTKQPNHNFCVFFVSCLNLTFFGNTREIKKFLNVLRNFFLTFIFTYIMHNTFFWSYMTFSAVPIYYANVY